MSILGARVLCKLRYRLWHFVRQKSGIPTPSNICRQQRTALSKLCRVAPKVAVWLHTVDLSLPCALVTEHRKGCSQMSSIGPRSETEACWPNASISPGARLPRGMLSCCVGRSSAAMRANTLHILHASSYDYKPFFFLHSEKTVQNCRWTFSLAYTIVTGGQ